MRPRAARISYTSGCDPDGAPCRKEGRKEGIEDGNHSPVTEDFATRVSLGGSIEQMEATHSRGTKVKLADGSREARLESVARPMRFSGVDVRRETENGRLALLGAVQNKEFRCSVIRSSWPPDNSIANSADTWSVLLAPTLYV